MRKNLIVAFLIASVVALFISAETFAGDSKNGKILYDKTCASCHQLNGQGIPPMFPSLKEGSAKNITDDQLFEKISKGNNSMPPFKDMLSEEQIYDIIKYLRELQQPR